MYKSSVIIIPVLAGCTKFPGKALHNILDVSVLARSYALANAVAKDIKNSTVLVATNDKKVMEFASKQNIPCFFINDHCSSAIHGLMLAVNSMQQQPDIIVNLSIDYPLLPIDFLKQLIIDSYNDKSFQVGVLGALLSWEQLQKWRQKKQEYPDNGISVVVDHNKHAKWFSRLILPAINDEAILQENQEHSPVYRYIDVSAYSFQMLKTFTRLAVGHYERIENILILRLLESGYSVKVIDKVVEIYPTCIELDSVEVIEDYENILHKKETV